MKKSGLFLLAPLMLVVLCSFSSNIQLNKAKINQMDQVCINGNKTPLMEDCLTIGFATADAFYNLASSTNLFEAGLWFTVAWYYFDLWASCV